MTWRTATTWILLVAAIASGWMLWRQSAPESASPKAQFRPDYVLTDLELIALDDQGREAFTLRAPRLTRDPTATSMDLQTPVFVIPPQPGQTGTPWEVRSATAWVAPKGDEIRLRGQVRADSLPGGAAEGVISRAFSSLADFVNLSGHLLAEGGALYAMKGVNPADEVAALPAGWAVAETHALVVPGLDAGRHLLVIRRAG